MFGQTYTWEDGLSVTISAPVAFTPSEFAALEDAAAYVLFDVVIVNGTSENYDPVIFTTTVQSGTAEGSRVFDGASGLGGSPSTALLAGREVTFKIGYGVADPADIVMEVRPGFDYDSAIFTT